MASREAIVALASTSPRRRELVQALDLDVETVSPAGEEGPPLEGESPAEYVRRLSLEKAQRAAGLTDARLVLAADTTVALDGKVFAKPADEADATRMLRELRGRTHLVITGVTVLDRRSGRWESSHTVSEVAMRCLTDEEIADYVASGEPMDKAGAYAVQDPKLRPAREVRGCYSNVVGLPLCEVISLLERFGVQARVRPDYRLPYECDDCLIEQGREAHEQ